MKNKHVFMILASILILLLGGQGIIMAQEPAIAIPPAGESCTSFCLDNDGYAVFGTNYDNAIHEGLIFVNRRNVAKTAIDPGTDGEVATWVSLYGSVTFSVGIYQFAWAGMNEAGLMMSTMFLSETQNPEADEHPPLRGPMWMQYQLDTAATVAEVIASEAQVRIMDTVDHYLVCDRYADCAVIEFLDGEMVAHSDESLPVPALTNNTYADSVETWQADTPSPEPPGSLGRFVLAADRVTDFEPDSTESAVDYAFETLAQVASEQYTQWSIVFDPENSRLSFRSKTNPEIQSLAFDDLDFSCSTPTLMLPVFTEGLSGDISDDLFDYDHDLSLETTLRYLEQYDRVDVPPETVALLMGLLESFPCME